MRPQGGAGVDRGGRVMRSREERHPRYLFVRLLRRRLLLLQLSLVVLVRLHLLLLLMPLLWSSLVLLVRRQWLLLLRLLLLGRVAPLLLRMTILHRRPGRRWGHYAIAWRWLLLWPYTVIGMTRLRKRRHC